MGKVQAPLALSSSNKVDMMGRSFCLLSSFEINPLSNCNMVGHIHDPTIAMNLPQDAAET